MKRLPVEEFARTMPPEKRSSVQSASAQKTSARMVALAASFPDPEAARTHAARIKAHVLDNLLELQDRLVEKWRANGIQVHFAADAREANEIIVDLCRRASPEGGVVVKAKSMATEEIHLNRHLEEAGYKPVETDLGEFVVQIDHDMPSHIVTPIIHKNRKEIAASFEREGIGPYTEVPEELAMQARATLRGYFQQAKIGISGVNFAAVDTGRIVLVENEGNNRLSTTAPDVHIALMGIEKMVPEEADLPLFLKLLAGSATGQMLTSYVHMISGPRREDEVDGPREMHVVLLDNGRSRVLNGPYRDILRCIRCGACLNVCPVYRQSSGHAYAHVYPGPLGAVLAPALEGVEKFGHLAKASTLCGSCQEVCPVKIPIPDMLLHLRDEGHRTRAVDDPAPWGAYAAGATHPTLWRYGLKMLPLAKAIPHPMKTGWAEFKELPEREGRNFRSWWNSHNTNQHVETPDRDQAVTVRLESVEPAPAPDLWARFEERATSLGASFVESIGEVTAGKLCYVDSDVPGLEGLARTENVWEAEIGITLADFAISETGSIVVSARNGRSRLASLSPPVHIALVGSVVSTVEEAIARMDGRTSVIITGTSRTADIEGILIRGVHGPKQLFITRAKMQTPEPVPSPCVLICRLDDRKVCIGCLRTIKEIAAWSSMSDEQKRQVWKRIGRPIE